MNPLERKAAALKILGPLAKPPPDSFYGEKQKQMATEPKETKESDKITFTVKMPKDTYRQIDELAKGMGLSINQLAKVGLTEYYARINKHMEK